MICNYDINISQFIPPIFAEAAWKIGKFLNAMPARERSRALHLFSAPPSLAVAQSMRIPFLEGRRDTIVVLGSREYVF